MIEDQPKSCLGINFTGFSRKAVSRRGRSKVFGAEPSTFSDFGKRGRTDLFVVVEAEGEICPSGTL